MYNLIEGMSYLFEDASALVIGCILDVERNATFSIHTLSQKTGISEASLIAFTEPLKNANLITDAAPTSVDIQNYRKAVGSWRKSQNSTAELSHTQEQMPVQITTAERDYMERVGGVTSVMFEMTYNCSEKCIHCYNIGATRNDDEQSHRGDSTALDLDDYKRIIDQLYDEGLVKVCLSGGDPFSNPYTWDVIDYLYKKNVAIDIFTNGLRLVGHEDRLLAYHPRKIGVSIYSSQDKVHDYITRIPGSWKKSMGVIEKLCCYGTPMDVKCCVMRPNVKTYRGGGRHRQEEWCNDTIRSGRYRLHRWRCMCQFLFASYKRTIQNCIEGYQCAVVCRQGIAELWRNEESDGGISLWCR